MKPNLELYYKETCPYCQKVLAALEEMGKQVPLRDTRDNPKNLEHLIQVAGKKQVPCLFIDGKPMHESDVIVAYLIEHRDQLDSAPVTRRM